jgi:hypothetical protein
MLWQLIDHGRLRTSRPAFAALSRGERTTGIEPATLGLGTRQTARGENDHDSLTRFASLPERKQRLDEPYLRAVRAVAQGLTSQ